MEQQCHKSVLKTGIYSLQAFTYLAIRQKCEFAAENYNGEHYSKQNEIKELKHYIKTDGSLKDLKRPP